MSTVAEQLRQAREAQNLTVQQVAEITKVRTDHIRALEEGNFNVFSAQVYIRGFVRSYAKLVKMDVPQVMAALDAELGQTEKFSEPPPLTDQPRTILDFLTLQLSKLNWRKGLILIGAAGIVVVMVAGFWTWRSNSTRRNHDPLSGLKPELYRPGSPTPGETLPVPKSAPSR